MKYCIVDTESKIITNIIVCDDCELASQFEAFPVYDGAKIGDLYDPSPGPSPTEQLNTILAFSRMLVQTVDLTPDQTIQVSALYPEWTLGSYKVGDIRPATYQGTHQPWKCRQEHDTATYPDITPDGTAWRTFWIPFHGTTPETAQPWIAPSGAHDQYEAGEYTIWTDGQLYLCNQNTAYSPEEYPRAWTLVES